MDGIVDVENKTEVNEQLRNAKEVLDAKGKEVLNKESSYRPLFSKFLDERRRMIAKTIRLKARRKAGMPTGSNGKPARPYTNGSEAINNMLLQKKESYLQEQKKLETTQLSELEFTKNIFEEVHRKQQEELTLTVIGLSDQYELSEIAAHLAVPAEVWFEWNVAQRKEYIAKFNSMSVNDALSKKTITVNDTIAERCTDREFHELSEELCKILVSERGHKEEVALAVKERALLLLNCPQAIQRLPTLDKRKAQNKFEVKSAKHGRVECTVHANHVSCRCLSFRADKVCKYSVAVAEKNEMLCKHLEQICKGQGKKKGLANCFSRSVCEKICCRKERVQKQVPLPPL